MSDDLSYHCRTWDWVCARISTMVRQDVCATPVYKQLTLSRLFANGHRNKAREVLFQLHGEENDELISKELSQMSEDLKLNASRNVASWQSMINGPGRRHRLFILVCMAVFGHSSGNNVRLHRSSLTTMLNSHR